MVSEVPSATRRSLRWRRNDGHEIRGEQFGADTAKPIVMLHGFAQTRHAWQRTADTLSEHNFSVISYDARGHGDSDYAEPHAYRPEDFASDLLDVCKQLSGAPIIVGASMGGLTAMLAIAEFQLAARALILVDITPTWTPQGLHQIIAFLQARPDGFESIAAAAECVEEYLAHRRRRPNTESLMKNLRQADNGRYYWHWDTAMLALAQNSQLHQRRLQKAAKHLKLPVLLISGAASELVTEPDIKTFLELVPQAEHIRVKQAGHMVAGDENTEFNSAIMNYLQDLQSKSMPQHRGGMTC